MTSISPDRDTIKAAETPNFESFIQQNMPRARYTPQTSVSEANYHAIRQKGTEKLQEHNFPQSMNITMNPEKWFIGEYVDKKQKFEAAVGNYENTFKTDPPDAVRVQTLGNRAIEASNASEQANIALLNRLEDLQTRDNIDFDEADKIQDLNDEVEVYQQGSMERVNYIHALANQRGIALVNPEGSNAPQ